MHHCRAGAVGGRHLVPLLGPGPRARRQWRRSLVRRAGGADLPTEGVSRARTPTGNAINPFFMAPQVVLHVFRAPSFTLLRLPALASGLAGAVDQLRLCRRAFGPRMAWLTTLIHAVLPINIAYSRFAWDASQSLLATLPVIYAAVLANQEPDRRLRWTVVGVLSLAVATIVHPTNLFVAPFLLILGAAAWRDRLAITWQNAGMRRIVLPLMLLASAAVLSPLDSANWRERRLAWQLESNSPDDSATCSAAPRVYEYISGTVDYGGFTPVSVQSASVFMADSAVAGLVAFALFHTIRRGKSAFDMYSGRSLVRHGDVLLRRRRSGRYRPALRALCDLSRCATVLLIARGFHWWMQPTTRFSLATAPLLLVIGWGMLATFKTQYFDEFNEGGGRSHLTFRTAGVEPKQQAMSDPPRPRSTRASPHQTSEWWLYWPLQYLAYAHDDVIVEFRSADDPRPLDQLAFADMEHWIVEFSDKRDRWKLTVVCRARSRSRSDCRQDDSS